jgi:hypothetical protein
MLNKIYLVLLAVAVLVMAFFTYYSWSWLQSIGSPLAVVENYDFYSEISWIFLWISGLVLLVIGNAILWTYRRSWAMWISAAYFAVFVLIKCFWLDPTFSSFRKINRLPEGGVILGPIAAVILCLVASGIVYFDQYIISRLAEKMHPAVPPPVPEADDGIVD